MTKLDNNFNCMLLKELISFDKNSFWMGVGWGLRWPVGGGEGSE